MTIRKYIIVFFLCLALILTGAATWAIAKQAAILTPPPSSFDGQRAYRDVLAQMAFGPRTVNSQAHENEVSYIQSELKKAGWASEIQQTQWQGYPVENIISTRDHRVPQIIIGAHFDSRSNADQDPGPGPHPPVPGANDGASGVAALLELARSLPASSKSVCLVFLDAEDNGGLDGQDWLMGSRAFVKALTFQPEAVIILDMIGDANLNIYIERNSTPALVSEIWQQAELMGYQQQFIPQAKWSMEDDHIPFLEAGISSIDIIDFDYPYWHTSADTADKVSPKSLQIVGVVIRAWIMAQK